MALDKQFLDLRRHWRALDVEACHDAEDWRIHHLRPILKEIAQDLDDPVERRFATKLLQATVALESDPTQKFAVLVRKKPVRQPVRANSRKGKVVKSPQVP
jgi:hypothetical protein